MTGPSSPTPSSREPSPIPQDDDFVEIKPADAPHMQIDQTVAHVASRALPREVQKALFKPPSLFDRITQRFSSTRTIDIDNIGREKLPKGEKQKLTKAHTLNEEFSKLSSELDDTLDSIKENPKNAAQHLEELPKLISNYTEAFNKTKKELDKLNTSGGSKDIERADKNLRTAHQAFFLHTGRVPEKSTELDHNGSTFMELCAQCACDQNKVLYFDTAGKPQVFDMSSLPKELQKALTQQKEYISSSGRDRETFRINIPKHIPKASGDRILGLITGCATKNSTSFSTFVQTARPASYSQPPADTLKRPRHADLYEELPAFPTDPTSGNSAPSKAAADRAPTTSTEPRASGKMAAASASPKPQATSLPRERPPSYPQAAAAADTPVSAAIPIRVADALVKQPPLANIPFRFNNYSDPKNLTALWTHLKENTPTCEMRTDSLVKDVGYIGRFKDVPCPIENALPGLHGNNHVGQGVTSYDFIATQAPLPNQMEQFWDMVPPNSLIVDLTTSQDRDSRGKQPTDFVQDYCSPTEGETVSFGKNNVSTWKLSNNSIFSTASYRIKKASNGTEETKQVNRIHYPDWEDQKGISPENLDQLVSTAKTYRGKPVLVHCRAGVGRTGTFIAASALEEGISKGSIRRNNLVTELAKITYTLRSQRGPMCIQKPDQLRSLLQYAEFLFEKQNQ